MDAKYVVVAAGIRSVVARLKAEGGAKLPPEAELCRAYGVSRQTVRQALALLAREGLVISRKGSGTFICTRPGEGSRVITAIIANPDGYAAPTFLGEARDMLAAHGYRLEVVATGGGARAEREALNAFIAAPTAGLLAEGRNTALPNPNYDLYEKLRMLRVPAVLWRGAEDAPAVCIREDDYNGGYMLARYLLGKGRAALAGAFQIDEQSGVERYNGFMCALRDADMPLPDERLLLYTSREREALFEPGFAPLWKQTFAGVDAVVCHDDEIAYNLIKLLRANGLRVPQDVAVTGFDNSYLCELSEPRITSLGHENSPARLACECLLDMLRGRDSASQTPGWRLYERKSTL